MLYGLKILPLCLLASLCFANADANPITNDQPDLLKMTVYNQDFAMIEEHRKLPALHSGQRVHLLNMSPAILPETLRIQNAGDILEQGVSQSSLNLHNLMQAYVGDRVQLARLNTATGHEAISQVELLSLDNHHALVRREGRIESIPLNTSEWRFIFPSDVPVHLQGENAIQFTTDGTEKSETAILSYLSSGLSWQMDYVMKLNDSANHINIEGLASVHNRTDGVFQNAELRLMAGDVNAPQAQPMMMRAMAMSDALGSAPEQSPEQMQDFYLYRLARPVSFQPHETKQLPLVQIDNLEAELNYRYQFSVWPALDHQRHQAQASLSLSFEAPVLDNQTSPLPAGNVRVFRPDRQGEIQFIGAANLGNLASGETAELALGRAFDLNIERRQTLFSDGFDTVTVQQEVSITNSGNEGRVVDLLAGFQQAWELKDSTHPMKENNAGQLIAQMHLPAGGTETLRFTVELKKRVNR